MTAVTWTPTAQTAGVVLLNSLKDVGMAQLNNEFQNFMSQAVNQAMPARLARFFLANEPFIFGSMLWPLFKYTISEKLRSRRHQSDRKVFPPWHRRRCSLLRVICGTTRRCGGELRRVSRAEFECLPWNQADAAAFFGQ
eukprot:CAMPEP_0174855460 /NCGR_PEP_ID=MMETSP1114-20130205/33334_1 /TAXON_ID=312471 /ORGANISM="Neobodo designis, Strain CCAP 1951/1" /LENGTH=138 /DNA_ID=CAMNT_0016090201 /DNA_START=34 /DNA_END=450 /DNA_ORIENTATION=+